MGDVERALLWHNLWMQTAPGVPPNDRPESYCISSAFSCPVTLVTSSKPSSSLFHLAASNEEAGSVMH